MIKWTNGWHLCLSLLAFLFTALPPAHAGFSASPFIADSSRETEDYTATFTSEVGHSAFYIAQKANPEPCGTYAGVLITPWRPFQGFQSIRFLAKGACSSDQDVYQPAVIVEWGTPGQVINRALATCSQAKHLGKAGDGYELLQFTAADFGLTSSSVVHNIIISDTGIATEGAFYVDDIHINDQRVMKDFADGTKFYNVTDCSPTGPLGSVVVLARGGTPGKTTLTLANSSNNPLTIFMTLGGAAPNTPCVAGGCVQDVTQVFPGMQQAGGSLVGKIVLPAGQSVSYSGGLTVQGNLSLGAVFQNCPRSGFPNGMNVGELTLNVPIGPNTQYPYQETVDVSCVAGVNADINISMTNGSNQPDTTWSNSIAGAVTSMENGPLNANLNKPGVFPPGCDDCADRTAINPPPCFAGFPCDAQHICNVQRPQSEEGGTVTITFKGSL